jgi:hypothetical protein
VPRYSPATRASVGATVTSWTSRGGGGGGFFGELASPPQATSTTKAAGIKERIGPP